MPKQMMKAGRVQSINDEGPALDKIGKVQKEKIRKMVRENAEEPERALLLVKNYCAGMTKIQARAVFDREESPENIVVHTAGSQYFFSLRTRTNEQ